MVDGSRSNGAAILGIGSVLVFTRIPRYLVHGLCGEIDESLDGGIRGGNKSDGVQQWPHSH